MDSTIIIILVVVICIVILLIAFYFYWRKKKKFEKDIQSKGDEIDLKDKENQQLKVLGVEKDRKLEKVFTGTNIHKAITSFINTGLKQKFLNPDLEVIFQVFLKWRKEYEVKINVESEAIEGDKNESCDLIAYHRGELNRIDYICTIGDEKYLIDFKTKKLKNKVMPLTILKWLTQLLSYKRALQIPDKLTEKQIKDKKKQKTSGVLIQKSIDVDKLAILHLSKNGYRFYIWNKDGGDENKKKRNEVESIENKILEYTEFEIDIHKTSFKNKVRDNFDLESDVENEEEK